MSLLSAPLALALAASAGTWTGEVETPAPSRRPRPVRWAAACGAVGGAALPAALNTAYLLDRNGPAVEDAQQAIESPLILLWANTWLAGGAGLLAAPTGAALCYGLAGGPASRAAGGWMTGLLAGAASLPVGMLLGAVAVRPFEGRAWSPGVVYGTYSAVTFTTMAAGGFLGFALVATPVPTPEGRVAPGVGLAGRF